MPDDKSRLKRRYAAAQSKLSAAEVGMRKASANALAKLLRLPRKRRLRILAKPAPDLTDADRLRLADSLADKDRPTAPTPNRLTMFGSLTRRGHANWTAFGLAVAYAGIVFAIAKANTPEQWVQFAPNLDLGIRWSLADGTPVAGYLATRPKFLLDTNQSDHAVIRVWIPGVGYAYTNVQTAWLQPAD